MRITDADEAYLDALCALEEQCFSSPWTRGQLRANLPDGQHELLLALDGDGKLLGYVGMMTVLDEGYIGNVAVDPAARRQGIGGALIEELLDRSRKRGLAFVTLEVRESNLAARGLYAGRGFVPVGLRKNYYTAPKENAVLMTYYLQ